MQQHVPQRSAAPTAVLPTAKLLNELFKSIYASNLKSRSVNVMSCLITYMNGKDNTCFPSIKTIAKCCSMGVSTVKRALADLVDAGFVEKEARFIEKKNMAQTSNLYRLSASITEPQPPKGEESPAITSESQAIELQEYVVVTFDSIATENATPDNVMEDDVVVLDLLEETNLPDNNTTCTPNITTPKIKFKCGESKVVYTAHQNIEKSTFSNKWTGEQSTLIPP